MMKYIIVFFLGIAIMSCNKESDYAIGEDYLDIKTNIRLVDTFSVKSYTVNLDSIRTSGYGKALIGKCEDENYGTVTSHSYFQLGLPSSKTLPDDAVFSSVELILLPDGYSFGDTLSAYGLEFFELEEEIEEPGESNYLFNTTSFSSMPDLLGSLSIMPRPNVMDTMKVPVEYSFGEDLFNKLLEEDDVVSEQNKFLDYKKGFVLKGNDDNLAVLRYNANDTSMFLRLHYNYFDYELTEDVIDFPLCNTSLQFNKIARSNTLLDSLDNQKEKLPSEDSGYKTFIQAGFPTVTRVEFQNIKKLLEFYDNVNILNAELILEPVKGTYTKNSLPDLVLYETDKRNNFNDVILDEAGSTQTGSLLVDDIYHEETTYTFDITYFIDEEIYTISDQDPALLITIPPDELNTSLERCTLGSFNNTVNKVKLKIYYMDYVDYE